MARKKPRQLKRLQSRRDQLTSRCDAPLHVVFRAIADTALQRLVLLSANSSGSGMVRRTPMLQRKWSRLKRDRLA
jgi:16S rRNA C967 or C1407 C5-methylase (RsmB/RsmF family)